MFAPNQKLAEQLMAILACSTGGESTATPPPPPPPPLLVWRQSKNPVYGAGQQIYTVETTGDSQK